MVLIDKLKQINSFKAPLFNKIGSKNLETECLFGEEFLIFDQHKSWSFGKLLTDDYIGWIQNKYLTNSIETSHRVITKTTNIYKSNNPKSIILNVLSMGSLVKTIEEFDNWFKVEVQNDFKKKYGFIPKTHLAKKSHNQYNWLQLAENMIDIPYVWGGRSSQGIDCSALLQITIRNGGIKIPRNTQEQINFFSMSRNFKSHIINKKTIYDKGSIIFWDGHVGFLLNKNKLLHANGHHMKVVKESIFKAIERLKKNNIKPTHLFTII